MKHEGPPWSSTLLMLALFISSPSMAIGSAWFLGGLVVTVAWLWMPFSLYLLYQFQKENRCGRPRGAKAAVFLGIPAVLTIAWFQSGFQDRLIARVTYRSAEQYMAFGEVSKADAAYNEAFALDPNLPSRVVPPASPHLAMPFRVEAIIAGCLVLAFCIMWEWLREMLVRDAKDAPRSARP